jgi:hypothetical protein
VAWKAHLFMGLMSSLMLLAIAGPAMADDNNRQERREFREDFFDFDHDIDFDDCCDDDFDDEDLEFVDFGFFAFFAVEEIDIGFDGLFDGGADCEVETEFFDFD